MGPYLSGMDVPSDFCDGQESMCSRERGITMFDRTHRITTYVATAVAMLILAGALATEARADFTLWHDEQLTVNTYHFLGALYDDSRGHIVAGGSVD